MFVKNIQMKVTTPTAVVCIYCGMSFLNRFMLEQGNCLRHPLGAGKGNHVIYPSDSKELYTCQFCSLQAHSISELTKEFCQNHPYKLRRGRHIPA